MFSSDQAFVRNKWYCSPAVETSCHYFQFQLVSDITAQLYVSPIIVQVPYMNLFACDFLIYVIYFLLLVLLNILSIFQFSSVQLAMSNRHTHLSYDKVFNGFLFLTSHYLLHKWFRLTASRWGVLLIYPGHFRFLGSDLDFLGVFFPCEMVFATFFFSGSIVEGLGPCWSLYVN